MAGKGKQIIEIFEAMEEELDLTLSLGTRTEKRPADRSQKTEKRPADRSQKRKRARVESENLSTGSSVEDKFKILERKFNERFSNMEKLNKQHVHDLALRIDSHFNYANQCISNQHTLTINCINKILCELRQLSFMLSPKNLAEL